MSDTTETGMEYVSMFQFSFKFLSKEGPNESLPGAANGAYVDTIQQKVNELLASMDVTDIEWEFLEAWEQPVNSGMDAEDLEAEGEIVPVRPGEESPFFKYENDNDN